MHSEAAGCPTYEGQQKTKRLETDDEAHGLEIPHPRRRPRLGWRRGAKLILKKVAILILEMATFLKINVRRTSRPINRITSTSMRSSVSSGVWCSDRVSGPSLGRHSFFRLSRMPVLDVRNTCSAQHGTTPFAEHKLVEGPPHGSPVHPADKLCVKSRIIEFV
jgi:hypothetical protein